MWQGFESQPKGAATPSNRICSPLYRDNRDIFLSPHTMIGSIGMKRGDVLLKLRRIGCAEEKC